MSSDNNSNNNNTKKTEASPGTNTNGYGHDIPRLSSSSAANIGNAHDSGKASKGEKVAGEVVKKETGKGMLERMAERVEDEIRGGRFGDW
jgi:hypothetical protein